MQLSDSGINLTVKMRILESMDNNVPKCNKIGFHKMLIEDRMTGAIRNADMWLRDVTQKLDRFALQPE
jgi:ABC-type phosphonate transport system ATPase subunit